MPPAAKKAVKAAEKPTAVPTPDESADGPICGLCWPQGWLGDAHTANCAHGEYTR